MSSVILVVFCMLCMSMLCVRSIFIPDWLTFFLTNAQWRLSNACLLGPEWQVDCWLASQLQRHASSLLLVFPSCFTSVNRAASSGSQTGTFWKQSVYSWAKGRALIKVCWVSENECVKIQTDCQLNRDCIRDNVWQWADRHIQNSKCSPLFYTTFTCVECSSWRSFIHPTVKKRWKHLVSQCSSSAQMCL